MNLTSAIEELKFCREMCRFNPLTGETGYTNKDNERTAEACDFLINYFAKSGMNSHDEKPEIGEIIMNQSQEEIISSIMSRIDCGSHSYDDVRSVVKKYAEFFTDETISKSEWLEDFKGRNHFTVATIFECVADVASDIILPSSDACPLNWEPSAPQTWADCFTKIGEFFKYGAFLMAEKETGSVWNSRLNC